MQAEGHDVSLFDAMLADDESAWRDAVERHRPTYAILYEDNFSYLSKMCLLRMREAAITMIGMAAGEHTTIIVCGADATDHPDIYLDAGADVVLLGEGDATLPALVSALEAGTDIGEIQGLAYRDDAGSVVSTPRRSVLRNLDALPFPAWDLIDAARYRDAWQQRHGRYSVNMVTTRGCPYHCNWCAKPIWGQRYNTRSPEHVVRDMQLLSETLAPDHIWFADDIMGLSPGWLTKFADALETAALRVPFKCLSRADLLLRSGDIDALARAGCETIWIGAESGSQSVLDAMEKGTTVDQIEQATSRLKAVGIRVGYFVQFGYPGETRADIDATMALVERMVPDEIGMSVSYPLPGTKFYDRVRDQLGSIQNWQDSSDMAMLYQGPYTTEFYRQLYILLHRSWALRRHRSHLRARASHPWQWRPSDVRRLAAAAYYSATIPLTRHRLHRIERQTHIGVRPLTPELERTAAGTPTPLDCARAEPARATTAASRDS